MTSRVSSAPELADARRAAAVLADAGVARVVLFGSVARGDATECSNIDLMAIYDDLDYAARWETRCALKPLAESAAGYPVDVVVTDRPEWKVRTTQVRASLENRAARHGVVLVDRPPTRVIDWGKEMVMPRSDREEAFHRLRRTADSLGILLTLLGPGRVEQMERRLGNETRALGRSLVRLQRACGEAHAVVEGSLKALIHLAADPERPAWGHDIAKLCDQLAEPHRSAIPPLLAPCGAVAISEWHVLARYHREGRDTEATPRLLGDLARIACAVASYAAEQFPTTRAAVETIRTDISYVVDYLETHDLATGQPVDS